MRDYFFSRPALIFAIFLIAVVAAVASACSPGKRLDVRPPGCTSLEESELCTDRTDPPSGIDYIEREREFRGDFR